MMVELEGRIEDAKLRKSSIEMEAITLDNIYKIIHNVKAEKSWHDAY